MTSRQKRMARALAKGLAGFAGGATPAAGGVDRRDFLKHGAGLGMAFGLPLLASCGGSDDGSLPPAPLRPVELRTLFFNLAHEEHAGKRYYLTGGGHRLLLTPVADQPQVLRDARARNAFLRAVPDAQITHHVADAPFAIDSVTMCYVSSEIDTAAGTWAMSSVQLYIPTAGAKPAFERARLTTPAGPLPLSAKRRRYGIAAAQSEQDLRDERELMDSASHASTLVGRHPDLMSLEPTAAHTVHSNHLDRSADVFALGLRLTSYGAATPQLAAGQPNASGWATLNPLLNDDGTPIKNETGQHRGRIQYLPNTQPALHGLIRAGMNTTTPLVKNDVTLGADITDRSPSDTGAAPLTGTMWMRHDGVTKVDQSALSSGMSSGTPGAPAACDNAVMVLKQKNAQVGYSVTAASTSNGGVTTASLTLLNWFLEFRGVYLQFLDANGTPIVLTSIDEYNNGTIVPKHRDDSDTDTAMFVSLMGPVFTVFAIPVAPGFLQPSFTVPKAATTVRVLSSGLSFQHGMDYPDTVLPGAIMTGIFNYGMTAILAACGGGSYVPELWRLVVIPLGQALALELIAIVTATQNPNGDVPLISQLATPGFWEGQAVVLAKLILTSATSSAMKTLIAALQGWFTASTLVDCIPIAGEIMEALSIATGLISIGETTAELALTPWTYVDDLVYQRDLSVTITHAEHDGTFPKDATGYAVTAMFDDGTPYLQSFDLAPSTPTIPPVVFRGVPSGGKLNVSVAFYKKGAHTGVQNQVLGKGSTGLIDNDPCVDATIEITEIAASIGPDTVYQHSLKTTLDANGNHLWAAAPAPLATTVTQGCAAGTLCALRSITVRQGTTTAAGSANGYLGYSWQSQNADPARAPSCDGGGVGPLDQLANLNTDGGNGGANAQLGYVNGSCGIGAPGVRVAYNLLTQAASNFYLDTSNPVTPMLRQVTLEPTPAFAAPSSSPTPSPSWGAFNFRSDALLLHPAGFLVSLNNTLHMLETHRIPLASMADSDAMTKLLARPLSGKGSRPGLLDTPVAAAISADGVILVLEYGNNRIQALDLGGNPVRHFNKQTAAGASPYSLTLTATDPMRGWTYLDLAVEFTGYIYVLACNPATAAYRMDIYHPDQPDGNPIATTTGVNAARLTVDFWRNVYTLNYEVLQLPGGAAAGLTEPSVSMWVPG